MYDFSGCNRNYKSLATEVDLTEEGVCRSAPAGHGARRTEGPAKQAYNCLLTAAEQGSGQAHIYRHGRGRRAADSAGYRLHA